MSVTPLEMPSCEAGSSVRESGGGGEEGREVKNFSGVFKSTTSTFFPSTNLCWVSVY